MEPTGAVIGAEEKPRAAMHGHNTSQERDPPVTKDHILAARGMGLAHQPISVAGRGFINALVGLTLEAESQHKVRGRRRGDRQMAQLRETLGALAYELLVARQNAAAAGFCYQSERDIYERPRCANLDQFRWARKAWKLLGLLDHARMRGEWVELNGPAFNSLSRGTYGVCRMRATVKLVQLAEDHGITAENLEAHFKPPIH